MPVIFATQEAGARESQVQGLPALHAKPSAEQGAKVAETARLWSDWDGEIQHQPTMVPVTLSCAFSRRTGNAGHCDR